MDYKFDSTMNFTTIMLGHKKKQVRLQSEEIYDPFRRTRQTLWSAVQMLTQKLCCQTIHDCPKVVPLHYESE